MTEARKPNPVKALWQRFKARMKCTWIGWVYICATRETIGNVLLAILLVGFFIGSFGFSSYMAVRPYSSWDELPCQTGTLVKAGEAGRGNSSSTLADEAGVRYKFYGTSLKPFIGQTLTVCYVTEVLIWPPFYSREIATIVYPDGTRRLHRRAATPIESAQSDILWMKVFWLWTALPSFLWLLKRYARAAWRARQAHLESLVSIHQNPRE